jgi:hypothetical protein
MSAFVQQATASSNVVTLPGPSTQGDLFVCLVEAFMPIGNPAPVVTLSDDAQGGGNQWTQAGVPSEQNYVGTYSVYTFIFYCLNGNIPASGQLSVTATISGSPATQVLALAEYSIPSTWVVDSTSYSTATGSGTSLSITAILAQAGELLIFGCFIQGSTLMAASGWNFRNNSTLLGLVDNLLGSSSGSQALNPATQNAALPWGGNILAFGPYVPPPTPTPSGGPNGAPAYPNGTPGVSTLRIALLNIWAKWPYRLIQDYNGKLYTASELINNPNPGTNALMQKMVNYDPITGTIVWVNQGVRVATLYTVTNLTQTPFETPL